MAADYDESLMTLVRAIVADDAAAVLRTLDKSGGSGEPAAKAQQTEIIELLSLAR
jgi:hypothetical protein